MNRMINVSLTQRVLSLLLLIGVLTACKETDDQRATLQVDLENSKTPIEGRMVYLINHDTGTLMDSAAVHQGKFTLSVPVDTGFVSFRANLFYRVKNTLRPRAYLGFENPFFIKTAEIGFYPDAGTTRLTPSKGMKGRSPEEIILTFDRVNLQTEAAFRHVNFRSGREPADRKYNAALVAKYPESVYLLHVLHAVKGQIDEKQVADLLKGFDRSLEKTPAYVQTQEFLAYDNSTGTAFPTDLHLTQPDQKAVSTLLPDDKKYKLVVFWASWCGPCRKEIPDIKALHASFKDMLHIYSISIDKHEDLWQKAMKQEDMPWAQYLLNDPASFTKINKKYQLEMIPVWVLFGPDNVMLERRVGYWEGEKSIRNAVALQLKK